MGCCKSKTTKAVLIPDDSESYDDNMSEFSESQGFQVTQQNPNNETHDKLRKIRPPRFKSNNFHEHLSCSICRNGVHEVEHKHSSSMAEEFGLGQFIQLRAVPKCTICQQVLLNDDALLRIQTSRLDRRKLLKRALKGKLYPFPFSKAALVVRSTASVPTQDWRAQRRKAKIKSKVPSTISIALDRLEYSDEERENYVFDQNFPNLTRPSSPF